MGSRRGRKALWWGHGVDGKLCGGVTERTESSVMGHGGDGKLCGGSRRKAL